MKKKIISMLLAMMLLFLAFTPVYAVTTATDIDGSIEIEEDIDLKEDIDINDIEIKDTLTSDLNDISNENYEINANDLTKNLNNVKTLQDLNLEEKEVNQNLKGDIVEATVGAFEYFLYDEKIYNSAGKYTGTEYSAEVVGYRGNASNVTIPSSVTYKKHSYTVTSVSSLYNDVYEENWEPSSITFPSSVANISALNINYKSVTSFNVDSANSEYSSQNGVLFDKNKKTIICYPAGKTDSSYSLPSSVREIGKQAFAYNSHIYTLTGLSNVTKVCSFAFLETSLSLKKSDFSSNCEFEVGALEAKANYAYANDGMFSYECMILTDGLYIISINKIGNETRNELNIPDVMDVTYYELNSDGTSKEVVATKQVSYIGENVYSFDSDLTNLVLPTTIKYIGSGAFSNCENLVNIENFPSDDKLASDSFSDTKYGGVSCFKYTISTDTETKKDIVTINEYIKANDEFNKDNTTENWSELVIPDYVRGMEVRAIASNLIKSSDDFVGSVTIPRYATTIGTSAFSSLKNVRSNNGYVNSELINRSKVEINDSYFNRNTTDLAVAIFYDYDETKGYMGDGSDDNGIIKESSYYVDLDSNGKDYLDFPRAQEGYRISEIYVNDIPYTKYSDYGISFTYTASAVDVKVTYIQILAEKIAVTPKTRNVAIGATYTLNLNITPYDAIQRAKWRSSHTKIATVNSTTGKVTGKAVGTVKIKAETVDGSDREVSVTIRVIPATVKNLKARKTKRQVKLSWSKAKGARKYEIYRSTKKSRGFKRIKTTTRTSYTMKKAKKTYYYKVRAVNGKYIGGYSKVVRVRR